MFRRYEKKFLNYQVEIMSKQVEEVNEIYTAMRGWRHDYHSHMQKLKAHIEAGQYAEAEAYLCGLERDLDRIRTKYRTGNVSVDAILNSKLSLARKEGIEINCKAEITEKLSIADIDLCVILGNLIDNAVEACRKMQEGKTRFLRIYMCIRKRQLYLSVSNSTDEPVRRREAEFISKKRGDHGHGLKRIDIVVERYQGYIRRANEPGVFATEILLPL